MADALHDGYWGAGTGNVSNFQDSGRSGCDLACGTTRNYAFKFVAARASVGRQPSAAPGLQANVVGLSRLTALHALKGGADISHATRDQQALGLLAGLALHDF